MSNSTSSYPLVKPRCLRLERVNRAGKAAGLSPGDVLVRLDGRLFDGKAHTLKTFFGGRARRERMLGFWRNGQIWQLWTDTGSLGRWRIMELPTEIDDAPLEIEGLRNWEVWVQPDGLYDTQPSRPGLMEALVPLNLVRMRLWPAFLIWLAVTLVCVMLGWTFGLLTQAIVWVYFWRAGPALQRQDWVARGFQLWRVMAMPSERALHKELANTVPELAFIHGRRQKPEVDPSSSVDASEALALKR